MEHMDRNGMNHKTLYINNVLKKSLPRDQLMLRD